MFAKYHFKMMLLVIIILTHFIQLTIKESKYINGSNLEYSSYVGVIAWGKVPNCVMWVKNWRLTLPDCNTWSSSGKVSITGTITEGSAAENMRQKVLIKKVNYTSGENQGSLKNRLVNSLNSLSLQFSERRAVIFSNLGEKDRSLLLALVFGQSNAGLSSQVYQYFTQAGLVHLISVSSYYFSLTIESFFFLGKSFSEKKRWVEVASVITTTICILLVGYPLVLQRVVYALFLDLLGRRVFHRPILPLYRLVLSSLLLFAVNPYAILDVGVEFSILASLGIHFFSQPPKLLCELGAMLPSKWGRRVPQILWLSVSTQIYTWPLIFYYFGQMSLMSPISNIAILWILPSILALGVGYWLIGQFYLPILPALAPIVSAPLSIFKAELRLLASFGFVAHFQARQQHLVLGYCLISFFTFVTFFNHKRYLRQSFYNNLYS
ncbi:hypothetical protein BH09PAT1_BH09PAT1_7510 [soil metagenome]